MGLGTHGLPQRLWIVKVNVRHILRRVHKRRRWARGTVPLMHQDHLSIRHRLQVQPAERGRTRQVIFHAARYIDDEAVLLARALAHPSPDHLRKEIARLGRTHQPDTVDRRYVGALREDRAVDQHRKRMLTECLQQSIALSQRHAAVDAPRVNAASAKLADQSMNVRYVNRKHQGHAPLLPSQVDP